MYKEYFRLNEMPFSIAPDPRFLFMSDRHREALAHLLYGVQGEGGIVLLTGEIGTGKTTLCRSLLQQIPAHIDIAFILNPKMSVTELLQTICEEFKIAVVPGDGTKAFVDAIHGYLLQANARGRRAVLLVDEAQNLDPQVLEQLRLLTNLETDTRKLLQIILIGQPELQKMLARPDLRQVSQRVVARYHLTHLVADEAAAYVAHRLRLCGAPPNIFPESLVRPLYRATGGVPRLINLVCDRALLGTYVQGRQQVTASTLRQAVKEVAAARRPLRAVVLVPLAALFLASVGVGVAMNVPGTLPGLGFGAPALAPDGAAPSSPRPEPIAAEVPPPAQSPVAAPAVPAPVAAAAPDPAPAMSNLEWPDAVSLEDSEALANQALFHSYGLGFNGRSKVDACRQAAALGMRCYVGRGGLSDLRLLDQPVLLHLHSAAGKTYSVTVLALDSQSAKVAIAGEERQVPLAQLADSWSGHYLLVWKPPAGFGDSLAIGQRGPGADWVRQALSRLDGIHDDSATSFDEALARRVRAFQLSEGIQPDGVVGPVTAIRLNVRLGEGGPRLSTGDKNG
jgi:general secretion pathway protein A